jgi:hypothetical protein
MVNEGEFDSLYTSNPGISQDSIGQVVDGLPLPISTHESRDIHEAPPKAEPIVQQLPRECEERIWNSQGNRKVRSS